MHPAEVKLIEVAKRVAPIGLQLAQAYNQEQAKLDLERVLTQERLGSIEGTQASRGALEALGRLTAAHKTAFATFVSAISKEFADAVTELPSGLRDEHARGIIDSINWQLAAQSEAYSTRERWIRAAEDICQLIDSRRSSCRFLDAGVVFSDDADCDRFQELMSIIEETHQAEVAALQERFARFSRASSLLAQKLPPPAG